MTDRTLVACNEAVNSANPIHNDDAARALGLRGGLVGGMTLFGYLTQPALERWGRRWVEAGAADARFRSPVYHGDRLRLQVIDPVVEEGECSAELVNAAGTVCASAVLSAPDERDTELPSLSGIPTTEEAGAQLPLIGYSTLRELPELRPMWFTPNPARATRGSAEITGVVDVETLAASSIAIMYNTFRAEGPRIHAGLVTRQLSSVAPGERLLARGRIKRTWRHRDRTFATNDVLVSTETGTPVLHVQNTTIWEVLA